MAIELVAGAITLVALLILVSVGIGAWMRGWEVDKLEAEIDDLEEDIAGLRDERNRILTAWKRHVAHLQNSAGAVDPGSVLDPDEYVRRLLLGPVVDESAGDPTGPARPTA